MFFNGKNSASPPYAAILWVLILLFLLRTIGQLIQYFSPVEWLPQLEAWQGSTLPYGFLLFSQLIILVAMIRITRQHASGCVRRSASKGKWLLAFGTIYFVAMASRLVIGLAHLSAHPWFYKFIPALFHLVLATFVLLIAGYHMNWVARDDKMDTDGTMQRRKMR